MTERFIDLNRLDGMVQYGYRLTAHCENCGHYGPVDLNKLIAKFGSDFDTVDRRDELVAALRCTKCGGSNVDIRMHGRDGANGIGGHR